MFIDPREVAAASSVAGMPVTGPDDLWDLFKGIGKDLNPRAVTRYLSSALIVNDQKLNIREQFVPSA